MGYTRQPNITIDTYKRLIESWAQEHHLSTITVTVPLRYAEDIKAYCAAHAYLTYIDPAVNEKWLRVLIHKPLSAREEVSA
jgi:hypothetical protein